VDTNAGAQVEGIFTGLQRRAAKRHIVSRNGKRDNPSIELEKFATFFPATRILFKAKSDDELFLYYGNPRMSSPSYDLSLVAGQLLAANKKIASLADEQQLKKSRGVKMKRREKEVSCFGEFWRWSSSFCW